MSISGTLRYGTRSPAVVSLQKQLAAVGVFTGPATGYYGPLTRAAVSAFEGVKHLHRDSRATADKMVRPCAWRASRAGGGA
jgi:peptidoglycan hydrolase-like protein with peptidoglycan-binding domain